MNSYLPSPRAVGPTDIKKGQSHTLTIFAHELRARLDPILLAARALNDQMSDLLTHHERREQIERQDRELARLIDLALAGRHRGSGPLRLATRGGVVDSSMLDA